MSWNEASLKKKIKKSCDELGWWSFAPTQSGMGAAGIPDRICCAPTVIKPEDVGRTVGVFVGIEAKVKGNKPTKLQMHQLKSIAAAGGIAIVATGEKGKPYVTETISADKELK